MNPKHKAVFFEIKVNDQGSLIALEDNLNIPFEVKRVYYIFDTKKGAKRGFHAHKNLKQLAIAVKGSCSFLLDDGKKQEHYTLNEPKKGLLIEGLLWREIYDFSDDCVLFVLANQYYDESDYIRDYQHFLDIVESSTMNLKD